jgi:acyl carrier protein
MEIQTHASKAPLKTRGELVEEIKRLVVDSVNIQHIPLHEIQDNTSLFGEGLGLDSVDVLEVVVAVERKYGLKVKDAKSGQHIFRSIGSIADFVAGAGNAAGNS